MYKGKEVSFCIPTLNNYTGLIALIESAEKGIVTPDKYFIIDNGGNLDETKLNSKCFISKPGFNLGVGSSWNVFIRGIPEIRIILNDDLILFEDTLKVFLDGCKDDGLYYPVGTGQVNSFSFTMVPDCVVNAVGDFDKEFYPAYFEDNDYHYRMRLAGFDIHPVYDCNVIHAGSQTLKNFTPQQTEQHHRNFRKNQDYYKRKWGGLPGHETYITPFNK